MINGVLTSLTEIDPAAYYTQTALAYVVLPDGRRLDEALRNDPLAPPIDLTAMAARSGKVGNLRNGAAIHAYVHRRYGDGELPDGLASSEVARLSAQVADQAGQIAVLQREAHRDRILRSKPDQNNWLTQAAIFREQMWRTVVEAVRALMTPFPTNKITVCGVYMLTDPVGHPLYVGQSVNVFARLSAHGDKEFHGVRILPCDREHLNDIEGLLIRLLRPPLNGHAKGWNGAPQSRLWTELIELEGFAEFWRAGDHEDAHSREAAAIADHADAARLRRSMIADRRKRA